MAIRYFCTECDEIISQSVCPKCKEIASPIYKCKCGALIHPNHIKCTKCDKDVEKKVDKKVEKPKSFFERFFGKK